MRILWFSNTPAAGDEFISSRGTGGWLKSLDKAIQDKVELHVAFYDRRYPQEFSVGKTKYHQLALQNAKSRIIRRLKHLFGKQTDLVQWLDLINRVKPDIIHIHGTEKPWILIAGHTDIPVLLSIQAILTVMNYKYFSGLTVADLPRRSHYKKLYSEFLQAGELERDNLKKIKYVMGRTDWDRRVYSIIAPQAQYFYGGEVLRDNFYNFQWDPHSRDNDKIIIHTTTGSLLFKGLETVCLAVNLLINNGINVEWRVAGIAETDNIVDILKNKLGSDFPKVGLLFLGSIEESELIKRLLEADVYVSPSHQDNSSNSLCEATMLGMPCVSTFAGGSGSIIKDGYSGILVQDGDPWAISGAVLELKKDKQLALQYGKIAREDALKRHDKNKVVSQVLETYLYILKKK